MSVTHKFLLTVVLAASIATAGGCRRRTAPVEEYKDTQPLPAEPMVVDAPTVGKYGGRFVFGETITPRAFIGTVIAFVGTALLLL